MPTQPMVTGRRRMVSAGHDARQDGGNAAAAGVALGAAHPDQARFSGIAPMATACASAARR